MDQTVFYNAKRAWWMQLCTSKGTGATSEAKNDATSVSRYRPLRTVERQ